MNSLIRIGEIGFGTDTECLRTFVGSCIAIVLHDPAAKAAVLAHVQLPSSINQPLSELGRYADTAIPELIRQLRQESFGVVSMVAHIAGGADMFPVAKARSIGRLNIDAVKGLLLSHRIPIITDDCGGTLARRLVFDIPSGRLRIELLDPPPIVTRPQRKMP